jgi:hypothetical protein
MVIKIANAKKLKGMPLARIKLKPVVFLCPEKERYHDY